MKISKGQNFRYGFYNIPASVRMTAIKNAGFDSTMLWWGDEYEDTDGTRFQLFDMAQKLGLTIETCHFPSTNADWLWRGGEEGKLFVKQFEAACKECGERGVKNLVIHMTKKLITPEPNEQGVVNFAKMLDAALSNGVVIALENTRFLRYNDYLLQRFSSPSIGFCFDCGHANCYTPNELPLEKYHEMLVTTHIHDNVGPSTEHHPDEHHIMGEGNVDFDNVFARLKYYGARSYNLESYCNETSRYFGKLSAEEYLQLSFDRLTAQMKKCGIEN